MRSSGRSASAMRGSDCGENIHSSNRRPAQAAPARAASGRTGGSSRRDGWCRRRAASPSGASVTRQVMPSSLPARMSPSDCGGRSGNQMRVDELQQHAAPVARPGRMRVDRQLRAVDARASRHRAASAARRCGRSPRVPRFRNWAHRRRSNSCSSRSPGSRDAERIARRALQDPRRARARQRLRRRRRIGAAALAPGGSAGSRQERRAAFLPRSGARPRQTQAG